MSLHLPSRRLLQSVRQTTLSSPSSALLSVSSRNVRPLSPLAPARGMQTTPALSAWWDRFTRKKRDTNIAPAVDPFEEQRNLAKGFQRDRASQQQPSLISRLSKDRMGESSIFSDEITESDRRAEEAGEGDGQKGDGADLAGGHATPQGASLVKEHIARATDPDPRSRVRWERKMVTRMIKRRLDGYDGETHDEKIRRTERQSDSKSPWLPTSTKKLVHLAHQVAGKRVDDALLQMRYSKKKIAREVSFQLAQARDEAVAARGMGLRLRGDQAKPFTPVRIQTKDGDWLTVDDPTRLYVAQAWVGRGPPRGFRIYYRSRGRKELWKRPQTSISFILKEEKTLIREYEEREAKKKSKGPWVHLPNRPVTAQRPYYSW